MDKQFYVMYLRPTRPDFAQTMTPEEMTIMQQHVAYWRPYLDNGTLIVYGPVFDPKAVYGIGIVGVSSEEELRLLIDKDPANKINKYEYFPMRAVVKQQL